MTDKPDHQTKLHIVPSQQEGMAVPFDDSDAPSQQMTKRGLSPRHLQLMTIAGGIGVGLFVGIGSTLRDAGPIPLIIGYLFYGLVFMWPTSLNTAEMVSWLPIRGSIYELATRFVDPALGFAMGWNYFLAGAMLVCTEYSAVATVIQYWNTDLNPAIWVTICMIVCTFLNLVAVKYYGESEFIMSSTKVLLLVGLIMVTFVTMVGGNPNHDAYGFRNWMHGNAIHSYYASGAGGRFLSICIAVRYAIFTVGGPDFVSLAAGEIQNPRRTIPRVAKMILVRILTFYITGVLAVGIICSSRDARLIGAISNGEAGAAASPWVVGMLLVGITGFLPGFINFLILLSGLSCGNAFLYNSSRTLYSLAQDGQAPKVLLKCTKSGVPWVCVATVSIISLLTFLVASNDSVVVFDWFVSLTTVCLIVHFTAMSWVFLGWYRALKSQGIERRGVNTERSSRFLFWTRKSNSDAARAPGDDGIIFPYIAPCASWTPYTCMFFGTIMTLGIGFDVFSPWSTQGFITSYFGVGWFGAAFVFWKVVKRTKFVDPATVDIYAEGLKQAIDKECRHWEEGGVEEKEHERLAEMNVFTRTWERFWGR